VEKQKIEFCDALIASKSRYPIAIPICGQ